MGPRDRLFKVLVVGDAAVGKTSLVRRLASDSFSRHYKSTVGGEAGTGTDPPRGREWNRRGRDGRGGPGPVPVVPCLGPGLCPEHPKQRGPSTAPASP